MAGCQRNDRTTDPRGDSRDDSAQQCRSASVEGGESEGKWEDGEREAASKNPLWKMENGNYE